MSCVQRSRHKCSLKGQRTPGPANRLTLWPSTPRSDWSANFPLIRTFDESCCKKPLEFVLCCNLNGQNQYVLTVRKAQNDLAFLFTFDYNKYVDS